MKFTLICTLLLPMLFSSSCAKKEKTCGRYYTFEHPVSVYPIKDSYNVGDTIWFEMNFSDTLKNTKVRDGGNGAWTEDIIWKNADFQSNYFRTIELNDSLVNSYCQNHNTWNQFFLSDILIGQEVNVFSYGIQYKLKYFTGKPFKLK